MSNIYTWSKTPLTNENADTGINWLEGTQLPSTVNNSARQLMARVAELLEDLSAANSTGGTANAQTVTLDSAFTALGTFKVCVITATLAVTGAATLDVNVIGAKPWKKYTAAGEVELQSGDVIAAMKCINVYSSAAGGGSGAWILLNPATSAINEALNQVSNAKLADMATATFKGRTTAGTGDPEDLTVTQATALLNVFTTALKGLVPASGAGGGTTFLRDDATFAVVPGSGTPLTDGDKGDVVVSAGGTVWTFDSAVVTAAAKTLLDDANVAAMRTTLELGTLATQNGTFSGTSSGTNTGDQTITLTGNVTGSGTGSFAATIANDAVTNAKLADVATSTIKGRVTAATGDPEDLTVAQVNTLLTQQTIVRKSGLEIVNNSTVLQDDDQLFFSVLANTKYEFEFDFIYGSNAAAGFKFTVTGPAAPTISVFHIEHVAPDGYGASPIATVHVAFSFAYSITHAANINGHVNIKGILHNGANAGTVQLQWAQNTANASNTTVREGAKLFYSVV